MSEEVQKQDTTTPVVQVQENIEQTKPIQTEESPNIKSETNKENWKRFREEREKDRKARIEAETVANQKRAEAEALKAAMEALIAKPTPQYQQEPQFHVEQSDEDLIEKKVQAALEKERIKAKQEQQQREAHELPKKLEQTYKDFNKVCSAENLDYLEFNYPEIAKAFAYMPEGFDKWSNVYQAVKRFVPQDAKEDGRRIEQNNMKPKTTAPLLTDTKPQGSPWQLTEERRQANWERMQRDRKSLS